METLFKDCGFGHPVTIETKALVESVAKEKNELRSNDIARVLITRFAHDDSLVKLLQQSAIEHFSSAPVRSGGYNAGQEEKHDEDEEDDEDADENYDNGKFIDSGAVEAKGKEANEATKNKEENNGPDQTPQLFQHGVLLLVRAMKVFDANSLHSIPLYSLARFIVFPSTHLLPSTLLAFRQSLDPALNGSSIPAEIAPRRKTSVDNQIVPTSPAKRSRVVTDNSSQESRPLNPATIRGRTTVPQCKATTT
ncbi:uncharacterized protein SPSK_01873 [Sporothrix schenckii 1099-18]|uniref:Uncharacterized protein n=1 Tax=Sporothrix schenckii 1099-18 TaxID=1397361 RepID=A0A0F2MEV5_SPOSC|nr:uncharacterized protein SPSK_01873 [Sporothrix schenckii 1099-18]KJR87604.1 hypothetical protein SPSK_01873 [Sporothrix schenckii 1099-18]